MSEDRFFCLVENNFSVKGVVAVIEGVVIYFFSAFMKGCYATDEAVHKCSIQLFKGLSSVVYPPRTLTVKKNAYITSEVSAGLPWIS